MTYESILPDAQGRYTYTPEDDAVWGELFDRQMAFLQGKATPAYFDGVRALRLTSAQVPQIADVDARLRR